MIVVSGILVVVAAVLLVIGLVRGDDDGGTTFVYASIAVSIVSAILLLVSVFLRRGEDVPAESGESATDRPSPFAPSSGDQSEGVTAVIPGGRTRPGAEPTPARRVPPAPVAPTAEADTAAFAASPEPASAPDEPAAAPAAPAPAAGEVLVVEGRPRYHVEGCRYLAGKEASPRSLAAARAEGFSACGVCKPDKVAAAAPAASVAPPAPVAGAGADATPRTRSVRRVTPPADGGPAKAAPAKTATKATKAPARAAAKTAAPASDRSAAMSALSPATATVVVIPDRDKYHRADCRFVRTADKTDEISRAQARRQGFSACGTCKP